MRNRILLILFLGVVCVLPALSQETGAPIEQAKRHDVNRLSKDYYIPHRFDGKTIIITGAARGMGKWAAVRAAREGANVVILDWLRKEGQHTADSICSFGGKALFVYGNIQKDEDCQRMIDTTIKVYGKLDYAILNAGVMDAVYSGAPFEYDEQRKLMPAMITDATDEYWEGVMATNATGTFKSLRAVLRQLVNQAQGGAVVVVSSIAGMTGLAGNPAYLASKHAVNGLVRSAAVDYAPYGIRVNSVNMAQTYTPMVTRAYEFVEAQEKAGVGFGMGKVKTMSLMAYCDSEHRGAFPWEQASNMLYLISDEASALTGAIIATDGGWTAF
ncbi:SDR family NAD(P)-dependent oxidoreductase [uncultured Odoribacter sp.]|uniref:SDR family NAD(P)-dependent oxidoreductase n=1 Tax=uncultured Odoribacter sp. TaxID=876416 RepID=UPI0026360BB9|nr:SDR family NAD(P)-dependent oxidoreductase [uncultured Odoribacter sp.]